MPHKNLTTPQLQTLSDDQVRSILRVEAGYCVVDEWVRSLAREVQQSRARRCGNCQHYIQFRGGACDRIGQWRDLSPDWFCADFTPKEP